MFCGHARLTMISGASSSSKGWHSLPQVQASLPAVLASGGWIAEIPPTIQGRQVGVPASSRRAFNEQNLVAGGQADATDVDDAGEVPGLSARLEQHPENPDPIVCCMSGLVARVLLLAGQARVPSRWHLPRTGPRIRAEPQKALEVHGQRSQHHEIAGVQRILLARRAVGWIVAPAEPPGLRDLTWPWPIRLNNSQASRPMDPSTHMLPSRDGVLCHKVGYQERGDASNLESKSRHVQPCPQPVDTWPGLVHSHICRPSRWLAQIPGMHRPVAGLNRAGLAVSAIAFNYGVPFSNCHLAITRIRKPVNSRPNYERFRAAPKCVAVFIPFDYSL